MWKRNIYEKNSCFTNLLSKENIFIKEYIINKNFKSQCNLVNCFALTKISKPSLKVYTF